MRRGDLRARSCGASAVASVEPDDQANRACVWRSGGTLIRAWNRRRMCCLRSTDGRGRWSSEQAARPGRDEWQERTCAELEDLDAGILALVTGWWWRWRSRIWIVSCWPRVRSSTRTSGLLRPGDGTACSMCARGDACDRGIRCCRGARAARGDDRGRRGSGGADECGHARWESRVPAHIKQFMSTSTAAMKLDLAARFDRLNDPAGCSPRTVAEILRASSRTEEPGCGSGGCRGRDRRHGTPGHCDRSCRHGEDDAAEGREGGAQAQGRQLIAVARRRRPRAWWEEIRDHRVEPARAAAGSRVAVGRGPSGAQVWTLLQPETTTRAASTSTDARSCTRGRAGSRCARGTGSWSTRPAWST
jgi:hypothetical protein